MRRVWMAELLIVAVTVLLVGGAEARRPGDASPGPRPLGTYECWPAEEAAPDRRA
jgi:hypothetical protein